MASRILSTYEEFGAGGVAQRTLQYAGSRLLDLSRCFNPNSRKAELSSGQRDLLTRNEIFRERHLGKRCFVIGNGPSLKNQDLSTLGGEITFVASAFWKHEIIDFWQPKYYCFADGLFFDGSRPMQDFFLDLRSRITSAIFWIPLQAEPFIKSSSLLPKDNTYYAAFRGHLAGTSMSTIDLVDQVPKGINVAQLAIMVAMYMGCSPIYLLGLDHDWLSHRGTDRHFYQDKTVDNHADAHGELSQYSYRHLMECQLTLWRGYETLLRLGVSRGTSILNATDGGFLDVFDRVRYEDIVSKERASGSE